MIDVTCAVIRNEDDLVLVVQRGVDTDHPYKWEFPGGKIDKGESEEECIIREIKEELSIDIIIFGHLPVVVHDYGHKKIRLVPFICDTLDDMPMLNEHLSFEWIEPSSLREVDFSEADIAVAESYLQSVNFVNSEQVPKNIPSQPDDDIELRSMVNSMMSQKEAEWVATSAVENPQIFRKLIDYSYSDDKKLAF
jgi:8-oxo-dGTP diphosphatase